jgi:hypothetical protein
MLLLIAVAVAQTSLLGKIVAQHDPQNGYEDYLRAAELVSTHDFGLYREVIGNINRPIEELPEGVTKDDDDLATKRKMVTKFSEALRIMREGNAKDVYDPRSGYTLETTFPELSYFKSLAFLDAGSAHVNMADGDSAAATNDFIAGLTFGEKLSTGPLVSRLVGLAADSILFRELNNDLSGLSLADATRLESFADVVLADKTSAAAAFKREMSMSLRDVDIILNQSDKLTDDDLDANLLNQLKGLSAPDRQQVARELTTMITLRSSKVVAALQGPDSDWLAAATEAGEPSPSATLSDSLYEAMWGGLGEIMIQQEARRRVQWRLLKLSAMAVEYRWHNGKLPNALADFAPDDEMDPVTGKDFMYRRDGPWFLMTAPTFANFESISLGTVKSRDTDEKTINP